MYVKHADCHSNNYGKQMFMQISNLVIQNMWGVLSVLQCWEHIIDGMLLIWLFHAQYKLRQMLVKFKKRKKTLLTVYHLFSLNRLLSTTIVHSRLTSWQHLAIILCNGHPCHTSL